jgi:hypothetical protein
MHRDELFSCLISTPDTFAFRWTRHGFISDRPAGQRRQGTGRWRDERIIGIIRSRENDRSQWSIWTRQNGILGIRIDHRHVVIRGSLLCRRIKMDGRRYVAWSFNPESLLCQGMRPVARSIESTLIRPGSKSIVWLTFFQVLRTGFATRFEINIHTFE